MAQSPVADLLFKAWCGQHLIEDIPASLVPPSIDAAYEIQASLVTALTPRFGEPVGYKVGASNSTAMQLLGIKEPFYGRLLAERVQSSPGKIRPVTASGTLVEAEFALRLGRDLSTSSAPFDDEQIAESVAAVIPAIEIVGSRFVDAKAMGAWALIADDGNFHAWIHGAENKAWQSIDLQSATMTLSVNGRVVTTGSGNRVLGSPLNSLRWLANTLAAQGRSLFAGEYISTGLCSDLYWARADDHVLADFGAFGRVEVTVE